MATLQLDVSPQQLLQMIAQLGIADLETIAYETSLLRARKIAPSLSKDESELLRQISATILIKQKRERLHTLGAKMEAHTISDADRQELIVLSDESERLNAKRLTLVSELAALRGLSFLEAMTDLGLLNPHVA